MIRDLLELSILADVHFPLIEQFLPRSALFVGGNPKNRKLEMRKTLAMTLAFTFLASSTGLAMAQASVNTDAGVSVETPAGDVGVDATGHANANKSGANANAGGKAATNVSGGNSDNTYGSVISSIKNSATVDLSSVTDDSDISIVLVSSLQGNAATEASALDNALAESVSSLTTLHSSIEANAAIKAKLEAGGYNVDDVVAVSSGVDGSVTIYVDDRA